MFKEGIMYVWSTRVRIMQLQETINRYFPPGNASLD